MTDDTRRPNLRPITVARDTIASIQEELAEKVAARNARLIALYIAGVPTKRIAEAAGMTQSSVRKIATGRGAVRASERPVTAADEVNLDWLRRVVKSAMDLDRQLDEVHTVRNRAILAAAADGVPLQTIADTAGVSRPRVSRLVNES